MREFMLLAAALATGAISLNQAFAQQDQEDMKVTGMVTEADKQTNEITIDDQKFILPDQAGVALWPQVGAEVTAFYEEQGDQKIITRIGQAQ